MDANLIKLAALSYEYINSQAANIILRQSKTTIHDAVAYKLLYTQKYKTQIDVMAELNKFNDKNISRVA